MEQDLIQLDDHVWYWPHHPDPDTVQPSIGVIAGQRNSIQVKRLFDKEMIANKGEVRIKIAPLNLWEKRGKYEKGEFIG